MTQPASHPSVFVQMGFTICGYSRGVYHLQREADGKVNFDGIGLLFSAQPIDEARSIKFFSLDGICGITGARPTRQAIEKMLLGWGTVDARRLEESGLPPEVTLQLCDVTSGEIRCEHQTVLRPNDIQYRHYVIIGTGDVVCYN